MKKVLKSVKSTTGLIKQSAKYILVVTRLIFPLTYFRQLYVIYNLKPLSHILSCTITLILYKQ